MIYWIVLVMQNSWPWEVVGVFKHLPKAKRLRAKVNRQLKDMEKYKRYKVWSVKVVGSCSDPDTDLQGKP